MTWAPFNSVINDKEVIDSLTYEQTKITKPILSEEQVADIEHTIIEAYTNSSLIELHYYKDSRDNLITGNISKIDPVNKRITLNNGLNIYFTNIIKIFIKST